MAKKGMHRLGFDLGGTKMMAVVYDGDWKVRGRARTKTKAAKGADALFARIVETVEAACEDAGLAPDSLRGIGMGAPGPIARSTGRIVFAPNLGLVDYPMEEKIREHFGVGAALDNDVNLGVLAELHFGAAVGHGTVLGVFPGTGIGGGLVVNGRIHRGASGAAGEIGHMVVDPVGPRCGCGKRGCLEALYSRPALAAQAAVLARRGEAPVLAAEAGTDLAKIRSGALARSIEGGDEAVEILMRHGARQIGRHLSGVLNTLSPDLLVLGGGLVEALPELFLEEVRRGVEETTLEVIVRHMDVAVARCGDDAVALGAAKLLDVE